ncbi:hypothetical protein TVD_08145 [Thioalkalivibrio versutus]|uniref:Uncharacterized protein n=1 Tax=Thioalkalivibrio versutus TaxID=106634 RepID=A0A0G3G767_9GAMM|nr:PD-(D/E)XK nuclease family protein [Thioalkalivibrio versutus]AKJ95332.1 hypothetical protein TVD_08145 [Thioalkalivibrio versutus]
MSSYPSRGVTGSDPVSRMTGEEGQDGGNPFERAGRQMDRLTHLINQDKAAKFLDLFGGVKMLGEAVGVVSENPVPRECGWHPESLTSLIGMRPGSIGKDTHGLLFQGAAYLQSPTEPQVTKALAAALDAPKDPEQRRERILNFLTALGTPQVVQEGLFCELAAQYPRIVAEQETRHDIEGGTDGRLKKGALDLVLWGPKRNDSTPMVVIEAKFGHQVTEGQLENYARWIERNWASGGNVDRVILSVDGGRKARNRHADWRNVSWFSLMRKWEELSLESCPSLRLVKSIIWEKQKE